MIETCRSGKALCSAGCNFHCTFCQNADIAHPRKILGAISVQDVPPQDIVSEALEQGCSSIAATYTEPAVFNEGPSPNTH